MNKFASIFLFEINAYTFIWVLYFFLALMVLVFIFILIFSFFKKQLHKKKRAWQDNVTNIISQAIFFEDGSISPLAIPHIDPQLLGNKTFRQYFIDEVIHAKKNLSGSPVVNLIRLYEMLELDKDSLQKIKSKKWHIKAKGIQELAIMEQVKYVKKIFRLTNDANELVRNEAQCALVNFYDFKGLRFLNVIVHPVSQWQQIQLINYLNDLQSSDPVHLKKWLRSKNSSVVAMALRLSSLYNCREVYDEVINCLKNGSQETRIIALEYLKKISGEDTADEIIMCYPSSGRTVKLSILSVLQEIAEEHHITFLMKQLHNSDDTIKLAAAKVLARIHPEGTQIFHQHLFADEFPWNAIFSQIENDRAA